MSRRNIVLITFDSLRADHCSFMGYRRETTPTMDKMARKGLYFENAIAASVPTAPSIVACFTGEYSLNNAIDFNPENWRRELASRKTLAEILRKNGYETLAFHANPYVSKYFGFNKGFSFFMDFVNKNEVEVLKYGSKLREIIWSIKKIIMKESSCIPWEKYYGTIVDTINKLKKPYFLWVLLLDTHTPYYPPRHFRRWCKVSSAHLTYIYWKLSKQGWKSNVEDRRVVDAYDDSIRYADAFVKTLWNDLKDDDPIFIMHADHGDGFGLHGFYHHPPMLYEELVHVPLVIYNSDLRGSIKKPVSLKDLGSTIIEFAELEDKLPSKSLVSGDNGWVISKVFEYGMRKVAVRMENWKFITGQKEIDELYNLKEDPCEQNNLIRDHLGLVKEMKRIVEKHIKHEHEIRRIKKLKAIKAI